MKKLYMAVLLISISIGAAMFFYMTTDSVEVDILNELELSTVENIAIVESDDPGGMVDGLEEEDKRAIIEELNSMEVRRANLFSATRPTDAQYVVFLETGANEVYQVHLYDSENSISFTSSNDSVNASRSYHYSNSNLHDIVSSIF